MLFTGVFGASALTFTKNKQRQQPVQDNAKAEINEAAETVVPF
jgi:hypothetical protein